MDRQSAGEFSFLLSIPIIASAGLLKLFDLMAAGDPVDWTSLLIGAVVSALTAWMFLAIVIEAWVWALLFLFHPLITTLPDLETAFYFSMVTFTTLGYGDVVLTGNWRTLASIQAANGVIVFGWTTALLFVFIQRVYNKE